MFLYHIENPFVGKTKKIQHVRGISATFQAFFKHHDHHTNDKLLSFWGLFLLLKNSELGLRKENKKLEAGHIVAKLSFGFWTSLFDVRYEHGQVLWPKLLKPTFPCLSKGQRTRTFLSRELNRIRFLRNRIFHYEPIWHWKDLSIQHTSIVNMTNGLSPSASRYLHVFDQFQTVYSDGRAQVEVRLRQEI